MLIRFKILFEITKLLAIYIEKSLLKILNYYINNNNYNAKNDKNLLHLNLFFHKFEKKKRVD